MRKLRKNKTGYAAYIALVVVVLLIAGGFYYELVYEPGLKVKGGGGSDNNNNNNQNNNTNNTTHGYVWTINSVGIKYMSDTTSRSSPIQYLVPVAQVSEGSGDYLLTSFTDDRSQTVVLTNNTFASGGAMNMRLVLGIVGTGDDCTFTNTTTFSMSDVINAPSSILTVHFGSIGFSTEGNYDADLTLEYLSGGTWHTINELST
jgi:hypothetical protein